MSNTSNNGGVNFMFVLIVGIVVATILNMLGGSGATTAPTTTSNAGTSAERQYVTNRFRQEGYSEAESRQAAEAVLKFHEAQKARQR